MPHTFFLVPGYGAQGASAKDLGGFFDAAGRGCVVSSSRGIIAAWQKSAANEPADTDDMRKALQKVAAAARTAALSMKGDIAELMRYSY
jgi:orotidine-5'-phosphate decarboxylase